MLVTALAIATMVQANTAELARYRAQILPPPTQTQFEELGWKATMWSAVVAAQRQDRPIVLWAMNGHPLACT
jgi:hypothetical protein